MATVGVFAAAFAVSALMSVAAAELTPRPKLNLADLYITSSAYGDSIPIVYGVVRVACHLIWSSGMITATPHKKLGGKGGGGAKNGGKKSAKGNNSAYTFTANLAYSVCEGPISTLNTVWANGMIIYDASRTATTQVNAKGNQVPTRVVGTTLYNITFHSGSSTQVVDPLVERYVDSTVSPTSLIGELIELGGELIDSTHNTPAYRNMCYLVFNNMNLANFGNSIPSIHAAVSSLSTGSISSQQLMNLDQEAFSLAQYGQVLFDAATLSMYIITSEGISVWDVNVGMEVRQALWADVWPSIVLSGGSVPLPAMWSLTPTQYLIGVTTAPAHAGLSGGEFAMTAIFDLNSLAFQSIGPILTNNDEALALNGAVLPLNAYGLPVGDSTFGGESAFVVITSGNGLPAVYCAYEYINPIQQAEEKTPLGGLLVTNLSGTYVWTVLQSDGIVTPDTDTFSDGVPARVVIGVPNLSAATTTAYFMPASTTSGYLGIYSITVTEGGAATGAKQDSISLADLGLDASRQYSIGDLQVDSVDSNLIIVLSDTTTHANLGCIFKWGGSGGVLWNTTMHAPPSIPSTTPGPTGITSGGTGAGFVNGTYGYFFPSTNAGFVMDTYNGEITWTAPGTDPVPGVGGAQASPIGYDGSQFAELCWNQTTGKIYFVYLNGSVGTSCTLQGIVEDCCARSGLEPGDYDASQLSSISMISPYASAGTTAGFVVSRRTDAKTIIGQLAEVFFFDTVETGGKLVFIPRGTSSVVTIPQQDLGEAKDAKGKNTGDSNFWKHTKKQELELPYEVHVKYFDQSQNFQYGAQYERRPKTPVPAMNANSIREITLPICLDSTTAKQMAQKALYTEWVERDSFATSLGWKYLYLDPADVVTVTTLDTSDSILDTNIVRTVKQQIGGDLSVSIDFVAEDDDTYTSVVLGDSGEGLIVPAQTLNITFTNMIVMDLPLLRDVDNVSTVVAPLYWGCVSYSSGAWPGASVLKSTDSSQDWSTNGASTAMLFAGTTSEALVNTTSPWCMNYDQSLTLYTFRGSSYTLSNATIETLDSGKNAMLVGSEIIQFLNATLNDDGSWTISGLYRGLRGTDWAIGTHVVGEVCVLLLPGPVQYDDYTSSNIGQTWEYEAITFGTVTPGPILPITLTGAALKPYPVCQVYSTLVSTATYDPATLVNGTLSNGNLTAKPTFSDSANMNVAGSQSISSGKWVFEVQQSGPTGSRGWYGIWNNPYPDIYQADGFGIMEASVLPFPSLGVDSLVSGFVQIVGNGTNADINVGGSLVLSNAVSGASETSPSLPIMVAVDLDALKIWVYDPNLGLWNNDPSANPATGVGGASFSGLSGPFIPYVGLSGVSSGILTANFGGEPDTNPFYNTIPAGYAGWGNPANNPYGILWDRRTRYAGGLMDGTGVVPLNEAYEEYNVYFTTTLANVGTFSSSNAANYYRSFMGLTTPICLYTPTEMATDGFNPVADWLYVVIYQVSAVVGEGFPKIVALPPLIL